MNIPGIQPIVLTGGRSVRFGRDKLREVVRAGNGSEPDRWLVDAPIGALREVFGPRVAAVGACDAEVAARANLVIADRYPGAGPAGGILSAIEARPSGGVFVLAGDLLLVTPAVVRAVLAAAAHSPDALAVLARTDRSLVEPCIGLYRADAAPYLRAVVQSGAPLHGAIPVERRIGVAIDDGPARNVNTPDDLALPDRP